MRVINTLILLILVSSCGQEFDDLKVVPVGDQQPIEQGEFGNLDEETQRNSRIDNYFYHVNADKVNAPIWINTKENKDDYGNEYMSTLISESHKVAKNYLELGDNFAYSNFMMLALTFPLHEGLYLSYRLVKNENDLRCINDKLLSDMKKKNDSSMDSTLGIMVSSYNNFMRYLRNTTPSFIPSCTSFDNSSKVLQYIKGADGTDIGPVQLSIRWHYRDFLANKKFLDLAQTFEYGLRYMMAGHRKLYYDTLEEIESSSRNDLYYANCIIDSVEGKDIISSQKLIRAAWSGKYNQGQAKKSCRIAEVEPYIKTGQYINHKDYHFYTALKKVETFVDSNKVGFTKDLSFELSDANKAALNQIIKNYQDTSGFKNDKILKIIKN